MLPRWLFLVPGVALILLRVIGYGIAMPGVSFNGMTFDAHTLLFASLAILCGTSPIFTKTFGISEKLLAEDPRMNRFFELVNLERGLMASAFALVVGAALLVTALNEWRLTGFDRLEYARTMRLVVPGATITALAIQTMLSSFFVSILGMRRR